LFLILLALPVYWIIERRRVLRGV